MKKILALLFIMCLSCLGQTSKYSAEVEKDLYDFAASAQKLDKEMKDFYSKYIELSLRIGEFDEKGVSLLRIDEQKKYKAALEKVFQKIVEEYGERWRTHSPEWKKLEKAIRAEFE
jgi:hypothetical protein